MYSSHCSGSIIRQHGASAAQGRVCAGRHHLDRGARRPRLPVPSPDRDHPAHPGLLSGGLCSPSGTGRRAAVGASPPASPSRDKDGRLPSPAAAAAAAASTRGASGATSVLGAGSTASPRPRASAAAAAAATATTAASPGASTATSCRPRLLHLTAAAAAAAGQTPTTTPSRG